MLVINSHGLTDAGRLREENEDQFLADGRLCLYVVADGMGGHGHGSVAARIATNAVWAFLKQHGAGPDDESPPAERLAYAIRFAHERVLAAMLRQPQLIGMGATIVAARMSGNRLITAHAGDCRLYRLRNGHLELLTEDHSWVNERIAAGELTPEEARTHPLRSMVTRAVGAIDEVPEVEVADYEMLTGDRYLLCSDGLSDMVPEPMIRRHLAAEDSLETTCRRLINAANARGGHNNITALVLEAQSYSIARRVAQLPRKVGSMVLGIAGQSTRR